MPKNLNDSKRQRSSAVTSILTNKHKEARQQHLKMHSMGVTGRVHNHHSHLKRRFVMPQVQFDDQIETIERGRCFTHEDLRKKHMIGKGKKKNYTQSGFKLLQLVLAHPQSFHDAMSKLARESQGLDVRIYVH